MAKHQPPSRLRYFENHPAVSIRLPVRLRNEFRDYAEAHDTTLGQLVTKLLKGEKQRFTDFNQGYAFGYAKATIGENLRIDCSRCRTPLQISQRQVVEIAEKLVGLRHVKCPYCDEQVTTEINRR